MQKPLILSLLALAATLAALTAKETPNVLFITVDDMSCDSIGAFGCELEDTSPNVDRLAAEGLRFEHAHVVVGNCKPSRNVMWSGRYPHNNGVEGFYNVPDPGWPHLVDLFKAGGYFTGIRGKVTHSTPYHPYAWDADLTILPDGSQAHMKDAHSYYLSTRNGIESADKAGKPFCLIINISDPHKPFYAQGGKKDPHVPSRVWTADDMPVPRFLPDDPAIRTELAEYYNSVRRADDCFAAAMKALTESGQEDHTVVLFLSDHGMPLPFAKTQLYHHSTNTPFIVRWPGVTDAGAVDDQHMVSAVDLLPTLLDIAGIEHPEGFDGRSFLPLLKGEPQEERDFVIKEYNENAGGSRDPMRAVQTRDYLYLFNPWSNGERIMKTATQGTVTYRTMKELAASDEYIAGRVRLIDHRVPQELYHTAEDPDSLHNLVDDAAHEKELARLQQILEASMVATGDHALEAFRNRHDPAALEAYVAAKEAEADARGAAKRKEKKAAQDKKAKAKKNARLIDLKTPASVSPGGPVTVAIPHSIPADLGEQLIHVTLKDGAGKKRIDRKIVKAAGVGTADVTFDVPADAAGVSFAVFIGEEYAGNLQHLSSKEIPSQ